MYRSYALLGVEEEHLHDRCWPAEGQFAEHLIRQGFEFGEERVVRVEIEVVVEDVASRGGWHVCPAG